MFANIFGRKKSTTAISKKRENIDATIDAIQKLKPQLEIIIKRNTFIELKVAAIVGDIRQNTDNKTKCMLLLQSKKKMEAELHKNYGIQTVMENQIAALESSIINLHMVKAMEDGNRVIKNAQAIVSIEQFEDLMDDIKEQEQIQSSISDLFTQQVQDVCTDADLLAEFNSYLPVVPLSVVPLSVDKQLVLPTAPTHSIAHQSHIESDADAQYLRELQASMS